MTWGGGNRNAAVTVERGDSRNAYVRISVEFGRILAGVNMGGTGNVVIL